MSVLLLDFIRVVIRGDLGETRRILALQPELATLSIGGGATRQSPASFFFDEIRHYLYAGDSALHMAAAAFQRPMAELLVSAGADGRRRNRRGAEPLHYAADTNHWNPESQASTITFLIAVGADPNAVDRDGVMPLHRAVRTRSLAAVQALIDGGADPSASNGRGSRPLDLARLTTGRGGSGSANARAEQQRIITFLLERGAVPGRTSGERPRP
jgi:hypothetical protein